MPELPTGTVTFLLTDIEGSTKLWEANSDSMRAALARHDALAAEVVLKHQGSLMKSRGEGDSQFIVFSRPSDAVAAACALQRTYSSEPWPEGAAIKVRMAVHTGEADLRDGDYYGTTVNRCARLRAVGWGGQILVSHTTAQLIGGSLGKDMGLTSLGRHGLRDMQGDMSEVFQLAHPDLRPDFPALNSISTCPNNVPQSVTTFIGRDKEIEEVKRLLENTRLLTITGSGGAGKTRLGLQVASELLDDTEWDGIWFVELASLADPSLVPQTAASALSVREEPGRPLIQTLTDYIQPRKILLIMDNCEHLLEACAHFADTLLKSCPKLRILASSREGLGITGETTYRIPSLSVPDQKITATTDSIAGFESVKLFVERSQSAQPGFKLTDQNAPAVSQLCVRLDGIPLALELAAARVKAMSVEQIASRLDDRFRLLTGGSRTALPRQQTLRAMIDWSYDLLSEKEKTLLNRLSVFAGGWTLEAAEKVCSDPVEQPAA